MPEHLRALVVILVLSSVTFLVMRPAATTLGMALDDFKRRRNLWLATTLIAFTAHQFWIFLVVAGVMIAIAARKESYPLALYFSLLFVVPPFADAVSGLGLVNQLMTLSFPRVLSLVILLPCYLSLRSRPDTLRVGRHPADWFLIAYLVLLLTLRFFVDSFTNTLRTALYYFLDVFLPYYVASRSLRSADDFREAMLGFVAGVALLAPVAAFEFVRHWLIYNSLHSALGITYQAGDYLLRSGNMRSLATTGHSIVLGFVTMVALLLHGTLRHVGARAWAWWLGLATLAVQSIASLARGPWVGLAIGVVVMAALGTNPVVRLLKLAAIALVVGSVVAVSPFGDDLIEYLPFVGSVDTGSITYRQRLFDASLIVLSQNPYFGSPNYVYDPAMQELSVGGFIDIVNTYIAVALSCGFVGLALFCGVFLSAGWSCLLALRSLADRHGLFYLQGCAVLAALVAAAATIATVSSISFIPMVWWSLCGLAVAYARVANVYAHETERAPPLVAMGAS